MDSSTSLTVMFVYCSAIAMTATVGRWSRGRFSNPARCIAQWPRVGLRDAGRHGLHGSMLPGTVRRRALADDLGEAGTERAERGAADRHADVGDAEAVAQEGHRPLDAAGPQVAVRCLAVRRAGP